MARLRRRYLECAGDRLKMRGGDHDQSGLRFVLRGKHVLAAARKSWRRIQLWRGVFGDVCAQLALVGDRETAHHGWVKLQTCAFRTPHHRIPFNFNLARTASHWERGAYWDRGRVNHGTSMYE